jgi:uncharacterized membrane protein
LISEEDAREVLLHLYDRVKSIRKLAEELGIADLLPALKGEAFSCNRTKIPVADEVSNIYAVKLDFDRLLKIVPKTLPNLAQKSKDYTQLILIVALIIVATSGAIMFLYTRRRSNLKKSEHHKELHKLWLHQILFLLE